MPWYLITIHMRSGKRMRGARWMDFINEDNIRKSLWNQASEKLGRMNIDDIKWETVKADHPEVLKVHSKGQGKR